MLRGSADCSTAIARRRDPFAAIASRGGCRTNWSTNRCVNQSWDHSPRSALGTRTCGTAPPLERFVSASVPPLPAQQLLGYLCDSLRDLGQRACLLTATFSVQDLPYSKSDMATEVTHSLPRTTRRFEAGPVPLGFSHQAPQPCTLAGKTANIFWLGRRRRRESRPTEVRYDLPESAVERHEPMVPARYPIQSPGLCCRLGAATLLSPVTDTPYVDGECPWRSVWKRGRRHGAHCLSVGRRGGRRGEVVLVHRLRLVFDPGRWGVH